MSDTQQPGADATGCRPDDDLHIYYIQGCLAPDDGIGLPGYLGTWEEEGTSFLFFSEPSPEAVDALVAGRPNACLLDTYRMTYAEWHGERVAPRRAGPFYVHPPWSPPSADSDVMNVVLHPGVVFGAGNHDTTRDCLTALALAWADRPVASVVDMGTGTGILALAAARMGCRRVVAVDANRLAVRTTRSNILRNAMADRILAVHGHAEDLMAMDADLVVANIHYDVMRRMVDTDGFWAKRRFILSGLLRSEARDIVWHLGQKHAIIKRTWAPDGIWHTCYGYLPGDAA